MNKNYPFPITITIETWIRLEPSFYVALLTGDGHSTDEGTPPWWELQRMGGELLPNVENYGEKNLEKYGPMDTNMQNSGKVDLKNTPKYLRVTFEFTISNQDAQEKRPQTAMKLCAHQFQDRKTNPSSSLPTLASFLTILPRKSPRLPPPLCIQPNGDFF